MDKKPTYTCKQCSKIFSSKSNLKRHHINLHQSDTSKVICHNCSQSFSNKSNLIRHLGRCKLESKPKFEKLSCILCNDFKDFRPNLLKHYGEVHGVDMSLKRFTFGSTQEFQDWKEEQEKASIAKYIKRQTRISKSKVIHYYRCHRDGFFKARGRNIRHFKLSGSNKINGCCPSRIDATILTDSGEVQVDYLESHVGHDRELGRIPLKKSERNLIASKISQNISFDDIINDIRDKIGDQSVERIHLLTRKDLYNIKMLYNLETDGVKSGDLSSSVVRYCKKEGCVGDQYSDLQVGDFLMVIMNDAQLEFLRKYGGDCVCVDSIAGLNSFDYGLTSVMVLDDLRQGFPCMFAFSNRFDSYIYKVIFDIMKNILGDTLNTKMFMSELDDNKYRAWCEIMATTPEKLISSWHLISEWKENLGKIESAEKQATVLKTLTTLVEEPNKSNYQKLFSQFMTNLDQDYDLHNFGFYFKSYFVANQNSWAHCFRQSDFNISFERLHKTLEYIYLKGKTYQVDKAVEAIMKMVRGKLFERQVILHKGKIFSKLKSLKRHHKASLPLSSASIVEEHKGIWMVYPVKGSGEPHKIETSYQDCQCELICEECGTCVHAYICSCPESSIKWNMCKHIHLLCTRLKTSNQSTDQYEEENPGFDEQETEETDIIKLLSTNTTTNIDQYKAQILEKVNQIFKITNTVEQCKILEDAITSAEQQINKTLNL